MQVKKGVWLDRQATAKCEHCPWLYVANSSTGVVAAAAGHVRKTHHFVNIEQYRQMAVWMPPAEAA